MQSSNLQDNPASLEYATVLISQKTDSGEPFIVHEVKPPLDEVLVRRFEREVNNGTISQAKWLCAMRRAFLTRLTEEAAGQ